MSEPHIHDCTGPSLTCPCGYVFRVPPISFFVEVRHNRVDVVDEHFNCDSMEAVIDALEEVVAQLKRSY